MLSLVTITIDRCKCIEFIDKIREARFIKVKNRQLNKFNRLVNKGREKASTHSSNNRSSNNNSNSNQVQGLDTSTSCNNNQSHTLEANDKWVVNLSKIPLIQAQQSVLAKGPNFAIAPNKPLSVDYITAIQSVCHTFTDQDAEELRADINTLLRRVQAPKPNLNKEEIKGLSELRKDKDRLVLTADKGVAMVVLDKDDYIERKKIYWHNQPIGP